MSGVALSIDDPIDRMPLVITAGGGYNRDVVILHLGDRAFVYKASEIIAAIEAVTGGGKDG